MTSTRPSVPRALATACVLLGSLLTSVGAQAASPVCLLRDDHSRAFFAAQGAAWLAWRVLEWEFERVVVTDDDVRVEFAR